MRGVPWFFLMLMCTKASAEICNYGDPGGFDIENALLRALDSIDATGLNPLSPLTPFLWLAKDQQQGGPPIHDIIRCHLQDYHGARLWSKLEHLANNAHDADTDEKFEKVRRDLEHTDVVSELLTKGENNHAAAFPVLAPLAELHLSVYRKLATRRDGKISEDYKKEHDNWLIWYTKIQLRYWKAYRDAERRRRKENIRTERKEAGKRYLREPGCNHHLHSFYAWHPSRYRSKDSPYETSIAEKLYEKNWDNQTYFEETRKEIRKLLDSCKIQSGDLIMMKEVDIRSSTNGAGTIGKNKDWWSCKSPAGSSCKWRNCPSDRKNNEFQDYYTENKCGQEQFWIYTNTRGEMIKHHTKVQIKWDSGYWLSLDGSKFKTRTCPGANAKTWTCGCETFTVDALRYGSTSNLYDGHAVDLTVYCGNKVKTLSVFITKKGSETNYKDKEKELPPTTQKYHRYKGNELL